LGIALIRGFVEKVVHNLLYSFGAVHFVKDDFALCVDDGERRIGRDRLLDYRTMDKTTRLVVV